MLYETAQDTVYWQHMQFNIEYWVYYESEIVPVSIASRHQTPPHNVPALSIKWLQCSQHYRYISSLVMYCSIAQYNFASSEKIYPTMMVQYPYCVPMNTDTTCTDNDECHLITH